jgi:hypothetical protein
LEQRIETKNMRILEKKIHEKKQIEEKWQIEKEKHERVRKESEIVMDDLMNHKQQIQSLEMEILQKNTFLKEKEESINQLENQIANKKDEEEQERRRIQIEREEWEKEKQKNEEEKKSLIEKLRIAERDVIDIKERVEQLEKEKENDFQIIENLKIEKQGLIGRLNQKEFSSQINQKKT